MAAPALHSDLGPVAFLLGTWAGQGDGDWPSSGSFRYGEELSFEHVGEPFLLYAQRSWAAGNGEPLHFERGFLRPSGPRRVELVLAHPLGIVEVAEGSVSANAIDVASTTVATTDRIPGHRDPAEVRAGRRHPALRARDGHARRADHPAPEGRAEAGLARSGMMTVTRRR